MVAIKVTIFDEMSNYCEFPVSGKCRFVSPGALKVRAVCVFLCFKYYAHAYTNVSALIVPAVVCSLVLYMYSNCTRIC